MPHPDRVFPHKCIFFIRKDYYKPVFVLFPAYKNSIIHNTTIMKTFRKQITLLVLAIVVSASTFASTALILSEEIVENDSAFYTYSGVVKDAKTNSTLPFASVEAIGSSVATVTNIDGEFTLKILKNSPVNSLKISYIGFKNLEVRLDGPDREKTLKLELEPSIASIAELTVRPVEDPGFISEVLRKVAENYNPDPERMTGFYRETIKQRRKYVSISEAVVDIYKSGYKNAYSVDHVKLDRGRKSADVEKMDTVFFKLQGGPAVSLMLDVVKNPYSLLTQEFAKVYDFNLENVITLNDRLHYVVGFKQKEYITDPYYFGKLYIDMDKLAISEAEFSLNTEDGDKAARFFIERKPAGMRIIPEKATYRTSYSMQNGKWFFNYARAEVNFKVNWNKKLFNSKYSIMSEIAVTDRKEGVAEKINMKERFKRNEFLNEMVYVYFEPDYWGAYNVIEPDQSIESAIRKLNRKIDK